MGTKVNYAINLLTSSLHSQGMDKKFQFVAADKSDLDLIRRTMQIHEDTFKQQVRELHRLYSVQKMLMEDLKREIKRHPQFTKHHNSTTQSGCSDKIDIQTPKDDPSSMERSGSCSGETKRSKTRGFNLEKPAAECISTGVSAIEESQAGPSSIDDSELVDLTLSIGCFSTKKSSKNYQKLQIREHGFAQKDASKELDSPMSFRSERGDQDCSGPNTPNSNSSATYNQERNRPHWLFQGLSINRT